MLYICKTSLLYVRAGEVVKGGDEPLGFGGRGTNRSKLNRLDLGV